MTGRTKAKRVPLLSRAEKVAIAIQVLKAEARKLRRKAARLDAKIQAQEAMS